jgi:hypothetical protein
MVVGETETRLGGERRKVGTSRAMLISAFGGARRPAACPPASPQEFGHELDRGGVGTGDLAFMTRPCPPSCLRHGWDGGIVWRQRAAEGGGSPMIAGNGWRRPGKLRRRNWGWIA